MLRIQHHFYLTTNLEHFNACCCCVRRWKQKQFLPYHGSRVDKKMKIKKNYNSENFPFTVTPSPVINCSVSNYTREIAEILCTSGYDGGLPQRFLLEMISRRNKAIK